jgi:stringent starvation protein B
VSADDTSHGMTSNRPYLLRAVYDWVCDNNLTPYVLVDAMREGVRVPPQVIKDGQVVLNIAMQAVANLDLGNDNIRFSARFSGVSQNIIIPVQAVLAIYAQENGQGMMFPAGEEDDAQPPPTGPGTDGDDDNAKPSTEDGDKPRRGAPHLRVIK